MEAEGRSFPPSGRRSQVDTNVASAGRHLDQSRAPPADRFISYLTSHTFTSTQYALLASLGNFGRTTMSGVSGVVVDFMGGNWALFFIITAVMVIPSLLLLIYVRKQLYARQKIWAEQPPEPGEGLAGN